MPSTTFVRVVGEGFVGEVIFDQFGGVGGT